MPSHEPVWGHLRSRGTRMTYLVWGKILETIGALFVAYVGIRACVIEVSIGRHLHRHVPVHRNVPADITDLERLRTVLSAVLERRERQFGLVEAILVGAGTLLIASGCVLYLIGLLREH